MVSDATEIPSTIKRCPCCNSCNIGFVANKQKNPETRKRVWCYAVTCNGCGLNTGFKHTFDRAVYFWNRRAYE